MESEIIKVDGKQILEHRVLDGVDFCPYCNNQLTEQNVVVFDITSDEFVDTKAYCKICASQFLRQINLKVAEANDVVVCFTCANPKKECRCNAKKIDYKLRKTLK